MKKLAMLLVLVLALTLTACGETADSDTNGDKDNTTTTTAGDDSAADDTGTTTASSSEFDADALVAKIATKDYIYTYTDGTQQVFCEVTNHSDRDLNVLVGADFSLNGTEVDSKSGGINVLGAGDTFLLSLAPEEAFDAIDYRIHVYAVTDTPAQLSCELTVNESGVELMSCTNESDEDASLARGYILYFAGETVTDFETLYFSGESGGLEAGETVTENCDTDTAYDSYKMFVNSVLIDG